MNWESEVDELRIRRKMAMQMGGEEAVARQHAKGRLTVRESIETLLDKDSHRDRPEVAARRQAMIHWAGENSRRHRGCLSPLPHHAAGTGGDEP